MKTEAFILWSFSLSNFSFNTQKIMVYTSDSPERVYPDDISIYNLLFNNQQNVDQDKVVFVDIENTSKFYTYGQAHTQILKATAAWKQEFDLQRGDVVALCSPNHIDYPIVTHGVVCAGKNIIEHQEEFN
jgi:acyl-coenzyme A synthetase/AMP-(fatty) acid ligase